MEGYAYYLAGSAATLALLYAGYALTLRGETFHHLKRVVLTGIVLTSLLFPLAASRLERPPLPDWLAALKRSTLSAPPSLQESTTPTNGQPLSAPPASTPPWAPVVLCLWALGAAMALSRYALSLAAFTRLVRDGQDAGPRRGCRIVLNDRVPSPVSWMHWVIISPADLQADGSLLLAHEEGHVRLHHTWDRLICDFTVRLQWFNPVAWLLLRELKAVHEYEADRYALNQDIDKDKYPVLLIRKATHAGLQPAAAGWNHSPLKTRLKMMYKPQSHPLRRLRTLWLALPATLALTAMAHPAAESSVTPRPLPAASLTPTSPVDTLYIIDGKKVGTTDMKRYKFITINDSVPALQTLVNPNEWSTCPIRQVIVLKEKAAKEILDTDKVVIEIILEK